MVRLLGLFWISVVIAVSQSGGCSGVDGFEELAKIKQVVDEACQCMMDSGHECEDIISAATTLESVVVGEGRSRVEYVLSKAEDVCLLSSLFSQRAVHGDVRVKRKKLILKTVPPPHR